MSEASDAAVWWPLAGRPRISSFWRRVLVAVVVLLVLGLGANAVRRALKGKSSRYDESTGWARELVREHVNVYETHQSEGTHAKYPPFFFVVMAPLSFLPVGLGASIWYLLNLAAGLGAVWLAVRAFRATDEPPPWGQALLVGGLVAWVIGTNLQTAQVNLLILFLLVLGLWLFVRGRDLSGGVALGLAVALKLTPALFVLYFLWKRELRMVAGAILGAILGTVVVPLLVLGPAYALEVTRSWADVILGFSRLGALGEGLGGLRHTNQSLSAAFHRFFVEVPAGAGREAFYVNVASFSFDTASTIVRGLSLALVAALAWWTRGGRLAARRDLAWGLELGLVALVMVLVSPVSWINHYVALLLPLAAVVETLRRMPPGAPGRRTVVRMLVLVVALLLTSASVLLMAFSLPFLGAVLLLAMGAGLRAGLRA